MGSSGVDGLLVELSGVASVQTILSVCLGISATLVEVSVVVVGFGEGANNGNEGEEGEDGFDGVLHRGGKTIKWYSCCSVF